MNATTETAQTCADLLRNAYPRHTAKHAARAAGVSADTAKRWTWGGASPSADTLLRMAAACDRFAAALERHLNDRRRARMAGHASAQHSPVAPTAGQQAGAMK